MPDGDIKLLGSQRELYTKHLFQVHVDSTWSAGFQKCSELSLEVGEITYWEGGSIIPWKVPGRVTIPDITLERGAFRSRKMYDWCLITANATTQKIPRRGDGDSTPTYLKPIEIWQLDRDADAATPLAKWYLHNAWVKKFVAGDWDNTVDEAVIESLTLAFDFFERMAA